MIIGSMPLPIDPTTDTHVLQWPRGPITIPLLELMIQIIIIVKFDLMINSGSSTVSQVRRTNTNWLFIFKKIFKVIYF
jgi:hypothetical protein